ncbi:tyrosine-type recombinase/integrase [Ferdinandcohnia sp. SAFN-114]|uniref:tyrosine-type recombinase/integrase n=1 Tax=Ferdinandcohnia sp. SAFN-114 TaxID=3387275 RepID=UPI003F7F059F
MVRINEINTKNEIEWHEKEVINVLSSPLIVNSDLYGPITDEILFTDDLWDFKKYNRLQKSNESNFQFDFSQIDVVFKYYIKVRVLKNLFFYDNDFTTAKAKFYHVRNFINWLVKEQVTHVELLDIYLLEKYFDQEKFKKCREEYIQQQKYAIKEFIDEIKNKNPGATNFQELYEFLDEVNSGLIKVQREEGKHPYIHQDVLNKIVSLAMKDIDNTTLLVTDRMSSCMIVILAETGMRIGEFEILEINKLINLSMSDEEEIFYLLEFITFKTTIEKDGRVVNSFMTNNAIKAYNALINLTSDRREKTNTRYLYISPKGTKYSHRTTIGKHIKRFFVRHQSELAFNQMSQNKLKNYKLWIPKIEDIKNGTRGIVSINDIGKSFYYVTAHQFRVTCATVLYEKGYKLDWIREHMNHLDEAMTTHYIRLRQLENKKEKLKETLKLRANKDGNLLETNINNVSNPHIKQELLDENIKKEYLQINKFLKRLEKKKVKLNLFNNIDQIIDILMLTETPLIETELGYCASNALSILCERQEYISTVNDAYYIVPHIPSIESLNFNYTRFLEKTKIINHNKKLFEKDIRYRNQYEMELSGLKKFIEKRLIPELEELKSEIKAFGVESVVEKYVEIEKIANNVNDIVSEVNKWKNTLLPKQLEES